MPNMQIPSVKLQFLVASLLHQWYHVSATPLSAYALVHQSPGSVFDYVIIGAGPAGLTLANRLTEDSSVSVAIIEAGTFYEDVVGNQSTVPGYDYHYNGKSPNETIPYVDWGFITTPQAVR